MAVGTFQNRVFGKPIWRTKLVNQFRAVHKDKEKKKTLANISGSFSPPKRDFFTAEQRFRETLYIKKRAGGCIAKNSGNLLDSLRAYKLSIAQRTQVQVEKFGQSVLDKFLHQIQIKCNETERKIRKADSYILIPHSVFYILIIILVALSSFFAGIIIANAEILHSALIWKAVLWTILITVAGISTMLLLLKVLKKPK